MKEITIIKRGIGTFLKFRCDCVLFSLKNLWRLLPAKFKIQAWHLRAPLNQALPTIEDPPITSNILLIEVYFSAIPFYWMESVKLWFLFCDPSIFLKTLDIPFLFHIWYIHTSFLKCHLHSSKTTIYLCSIMVLIVHSKILPFDCFQRNCDDSFIIKIYMIILSG